MSLGVYRGRRVAEDWFMLRNPSLISLPYVRANMDETGGVFREMGAKDHFTLGAPSGQQHLPSCLYAFCALKKEELEKANPA